MKKIFLNYKKYILIILALLFILITVFGLVTVYNLDESILHISKALEGKQEFGQTNLNYPSLSKYIIFGVEKMATSLEPTEYSLTILCFLSILLGLFAEFQVRTYHATQCKPTYILRETINIE